MSLNAESLAQTIGFELLEDPLAQDVEQTLSSVIEAGVVFNCGSTPLTIFRHAVKEAIGRIQKDNRAHLFLRFLKDGPYEYDGQIPPELQGQRLTIEETARVVTFIYSHMVNCFKGALAEILAVKPCLEIVNKCQSNNLLPKDAVLYVGDAVMMAKQKKGDFAKGADLTILALHKNERAIQLIEVLGVVEVKSYFRSPELMKRQLEKHLARAKRGLCICDQPFSGEMIAIGKHDNGAALQIAVTPEHWLLSRKFHYEETDGRKFLLISPTIPPTQMNIIDQTGKWEWHITLRWSKEALDSAAYGMTFWFMEKVGEMIYSQNMRKEWKEMSPAEAGCNAAKMMLYYALRPYIQKRKELNDQEKELSKKDTRLLQRAVALYNTYSFGFALGMNYKNSQGKRDMLWPEDLDDILAQNQNEKG